MSKSDFGKGLTYCLGLFLAHAERYSHQKEKYKQRDESLFGLAETFFNGASDHLYELEYKQAKTVYLRSRLRVFKDKCLTWGRGFDSRFSPTEKDVRWAIQEAKNLLRLIDKSNGIKTKQGTWE